ncbi:protein ALP1-like [Populus nigra]|uniref:protein ALP1-like n=1 Tax=Populus nigra TaxID=3691 RepID=UPI002B265A92|nr:protein ALP1-like [Populus nigra]
MDSNWFTALFDDHYENVMNNVGRYVSDGFAGTSSVSGVGGSVGDSYGNYNSEVQDNDLNQQDDNDGGDLFWHRECDRTKLVICTAGALTMYYNTLKPSRRMSVIEKVGMFLYTLALGASNREVQERFHHSGETISRNFKEVLRSVCLLAADFIRLVDPKFTTTPLEIEMNPRYMPYFKNCIGAIDGTHVRACVSQEIQIPFIGRNGIPTQNIMAACSFNMQFTFVWAGWEGSAHNTRIFYEAIGNTNIQFPRPPEGKYYLVDSGYPNEYGYLGPYRGERYHLPEFHRRGQPRSREELFNRVHSSLRCVIECTFGVWKKRWRILQTMPEFPYKSQVKIVVASMALHNYIRRKSGQDVAFNKFDSHPDFVPPDTFPDVVPQSQTTGHQSASRMDYIRDGITNSLMGQ